MQPPTADPIESARRFYARNCAHQSHSSPAILAAFSIVPASVFVGPGPWMIKNRDTNGSLKAPIPATSIAIRSSCSTKPNLNKRPASLWAFPSQPARRAPRRSHSSSRLRHRILHGNPGRTHRPAGKSHRHRNRRRPRSPCARSARALAQVTLIQADGAKGPFDPADRPWSAPEQPHPLPAWLAASSPEARCFFP